MAILTTKSLLRAILVVGTLSATLEPSTATFDLGGLFGAGAAIGKAAVKVAANAGIKIGGKAADGYGYAGGVKAGVSVGAGVGIKQIPYASGSDSVFSIEFEVAGGVSAGNVCEDGKIHTAIIRLNPAYHQNPPCAFQIAAKGFQFARTAFEIVKGKFDTYEHRVTCRTDAGSSPGKDGAMVDIDLDINYKYNNDNGYDNGYGTAAPKPTQKNDGYNDNMKQKHKMKRKVRNSGHCSGWGDPHLTTLDGVAYDFQAPGVFKLFQSGNFQVQIFQEKCAPVAKLGDAAPSCYQGVAVAFGASVARMFIKDGKIAVAKGTNTLDWLSVEKLGGNTDGYRIFTTVDHATYVDVNLATWINNYPYLNVALQVSPYFKTGDVNGLMGNWNGNPADDLKDNAKLASLHGINIADNLFTCAGTACTKFLKAGSLTDSMAKALPNNLPLLHQGFTPVPASSILLKAFSPALAAPVQKKVLRRAQATAAPFSPEKAKTLCGQVISGLPGCTKYVPNQSFFINEVCAADALLLQDLSVVDNTKISYLRECRRELDARIAANTTSPEESKALLFDRTQLQFGDVSGCASNCNGKGSCLAAGCKCNDGFTGFACEIAL